MGLYSDFVDNKGRIIPFERVLQLAVEYDGQLKMYIGPRAVQRVVTSLLNSGSSYEVMRAQNARNAYNDALLDHLVAKADFAGCEVVSSLDL